MRYVKVENNTPTDYSIEQLLIDHPTATIYKKTQMPNEQLLANYNVYPLITEPLPTLNEDETAEEGDPEFIDGEWHQTWNTRKLTENEIQEIVNNRLPTLSSKGDNDDADHTFLTTDKIYIQRYEICNTCPSFSALKTCKECGCIMQLKTKIASAVCPLGKW